MYLVDLTKIKYAAALSVFILAATLSAQFAQPFKWSWTENAGKLEVKVEIPQGHYLYQDKTSVKITGADGKEIPAAVKPEIVKHHDSISGSDLPIYPGGKTSVWTFPLKDGKPPYEITAEFQGCKDKTADSGAVCFRPEKEKFTVGGIKVESVKVPKAPAGKIQASGFDHLMAKLKRVAEDFDISSSSSGYMAPDEFLDFLKGKESLRFKDIFSGDNLLWTILVILLGGLALNLTPCVLPLIPVNLAIIGAGYSADSKFNGFLRGLIYGAGIALAYGGLGVITVLTGAKFGSPNSYPWFNFIIAAVFIVLALAMFDVFIIDLSKFNVKVGPKQHDGKLNFFWVFFLGLVAALLAGACVAPVVIAVLVYASTMYAKGNFWGLSYPFLLGIGMALPWPFAGAGISFLPKPGKWMTRIKYVFGAFIIIFALYYAWTGFSLITKKSDEETDADREIRRMIYKLEQAKKENKKVFVDFWANWCKNCLAMEAETFSDARVKETLGEFIVIKFQAEEPNAVNIAPVLDYFKVKGLPTYLILTPNSENGSE